MNRRDPNELIDPMENYEENKMDKNMDTAALGELDEQERAALLAMDTKEKDMNEQTKSEIERAKELLKSKGYALKERINLVREEVKMDENTTIFFMPGLSLFRIQGEARKDHLNGMVLACKPTQKQDNWLLAGVIVQMKTMFGMVKLYGKVGNRILKGEKGAVQLDMQSWNAIFDPTMFQAEIEKQFKEVYGDLSGKEVTLDTGKVQARIKLQNGQEVEVFYAVGLDCRNRIKARDISKQEIKREVQEIEADEELDSLLS